MSQVVIFNNEAGVMAVFHPSDERLEAVGIHALAQKNVPAGKPYKIIDATELPDRSQRDAWAIRDADLTDGVGAI